MAITSAPNQNITYLLFDGDTIIDRMILNTSQYPHTASAARALWQSRIKREGNENLRVAVVLGKSDGRLFNDEQVRGKDWVMALKEADQHNFNTLLSAAANNDLVLVQSKDKETGEYRALLCARWQDGDLICLTPLAQMVTGNPFEQYEDPTTCMKDDEHDVH